MTPGGMPRREKLRTIYRKFLRKPPWNEKLASADEFSRTFHPQYALFVASGTPKEMRDQIHLRR